VSAPVELAHKRALLTARTGEAPTPAAAGPAEPEGAEVPLGRAVRACDIAADEPVTWLQYGEIPACEIVLVVGDAGGCKTGYVLKVAAAKAAEGMQVLLVSEEDPPAVLRNRLEAIAVGHRWDVAVVLRNVHVLALTGLQLTDLRWQAHLLSEVERLGALLVVLDPLFELTGADEDSNVAQRPILRFLRLLMARTGATVIVVHHFGKAGEGKRKIDRVRGASAWFGAARAVYALEARDDGVGVECLKMSRALRPAPYVLELTVVSDEENPGVWRSATFRRRSLEAADVDLAEAWILERLAPAGARFTTTELRALAMGTGRSREDLAGGLRRLAASGRITFDPGPRGAKYWRLPTLPDASGKVAEPTLPTLPGGCRAGSAGTPPPCPPPLGGKARLAATAPAGILGDALQQWVACPHTANGEMPPHAWQERPGGTVWICGLCRPQPEPAA
jgi:KaiC/GvpD/RAD55 family RecA-like ATPase